MKRKELNLLANHVLLRAAERSQKLNGLTACWLKTLSPAERRLCRQFEAEIKTAANSLADQLEKKPESQPVVGITKDGKKVSGELF